MMSTDNDLLRRVHAGLGVLDRELVSAWEMLPASTRQWLSIRRTKLAVITVVVTTLAAGPGWLPVMAVYLYIAQSTDRRVQPAVVPLVVGGVLSTWIGSVATGLGVASIDTSGITQFTVLGAALVGAGGFAERHIHAQIAVHDPRAAGLGTQILLGRCANRWITAPCQVATLVIGPPRSGKTSGIVIPNDCG